MKGRFPSPKRWPDFTRYGGSADRFLRPSCLATQGFKA